MSDAPQGPGWWQASDGKFYPPQPPTSPPPPPPSQIPAGYPVQASPQQGMSGCLKAALIVGGLLLVLGLGSCIALALAADEVAENIDDAVDDIEEDDAREARDVGEPDCRVGESGFMEAELTVTNNSSERSNYIIDVTFESPDGTQLETAVLFVNDLEPDQSTTDTASSLTEASGEFTCRVVDLERFSAEN